MRPLPPADNGDPPPSPNAAANCLRLSFHDAGTYVDIDEIFG